ncbi:hypothetical protein OAT67_02475 [Bacteriovoracaceae bacterium]|nr:hypothetical protein [Bacteriovoracaceae bacterium]
MKKLLLAMLLTFSSIAFAQDSRTKNFLIEEVYRNSDLSVRQQIIKTMRTYISNNDIQRTLKSIVTDPREMTMIRQEAARSLSAVASDNDIERALTTAHDGSTDIDLRATILRSLYKAASENNRIKNVMINNLLQNHDVRIQKASAFGLMRAIESSSDANTLITLAERPGLHPDVKVDIIKSLFNATGRSSTLNSLEMIATNASENANVRAAAIRVLGSAPYTSSRRNLLFSLASNDYSAIVKAQAASALKFTLTETDIRWLRLDRNPGTRSERNPFEL